MTPDVPPLVASTLSSPVAHATPVSQIIVVVDVEMPPARSAATGTATVMPASDDYTLDAVTSFAGLTVPARAVDIGRALPGRPKLSSAWLWSALREFSVQVRVLLIEGQRRSTASDVFKMGHSGTREILP
jgi:hypothetical protein